MADTRGRAGGDRSHSRSLALWIAKQSTSGRKVILAALFVVVSILVLPPLAFVLSTSVASGGEGATTWSFSRYISLLNDSSLLGLLKNTLLFSAGSSVLSIAIGTFLAFVVVRTDMPLKGVVIAANTFLLAFPGMIYAVGWILLLSDRGVLTSWLTELVGSKEPLFTIYSVSGMMIVEGFSWVPLTFLLMTALLGSMDMALEESAYMSGANTRGTIFRITLPLVFPGIASLFILNFMRGLEAFEVPALVGLPGHVEVLASEVFLLTKTFPPRYGTAAAFSALLILLVGIFLFLHRRMMVKAAESFQTVRGKGYRPGLFRLAGWRWPMAFIVQLLLFVGFGLPVLSLLWASLLPYYQNPSFGALSSITAENYVSVLGDSTLLGSIGNSLIVAVVAALATMCITCLAAWVIARTKSTMISVLDVLITLPLVIPGVVMGLAMLELSLNLPIPLFGTLWVIILAYIASYLPYGMRYAMPGVMQIHSELEDSAYVSGASEIQVLIKIVFPLMRRAIFGGVLFIFMIAFRELPRALLLQGLHTKLISVTLFELWTDGQLGEVGAFGLLFSVSLGLLGLGARRVFGQSAVKMN